MLVWPMARHRVTVTCFHPLNPSATPSPHLSLVRLRVSPPYAHVLSYRISVVSSVALSCRIWIYRYICVWACFSFCFHSLFLRHAQTFLWKSRPPPGRQSLHCLLPPTCVFPSLVCVHIIPFISMPSPPSFTPSSESVFLTFLGFLQVSK